MEIVLLGTSAALPTQSRWPSSSAVIREGEILLFDCGEGTQIQFQKAQLKPGKLSRIFISHFHGDHFYGLIGL
ncbi:MAG TPA: MBL fold metallo-hydrolase, partial [bacterium]